ncbi:hypothetical protein D024_2274 [Vibrio parahaemolyticus 3259]|nr:hypothetical protein D024_2274 [Vibrio parahaemolyticus 3259]
MWLSFGAIYLFTLSAIVNANKATFPFNRKSKNFPKSSLYEKQ